MKLFAQVYLDEDVSALIATLLRTRGFDTTTARDEGMLAQDDGAQLARAASLGRCIVTHNRVHFERLHEESICLPVKSTAALSLRPVAAPTT